VTEFLIQTTLDVGDDVRCFACPYCHGTFEKNERWQTMLAGKDAICPHCEAIAVIPRPDVHDPAQSVHV